MSAYLLRRVLTTIPLLLTIVVISFVFMRLAPGGPFDSEKQLPPEIEANLRAAYNLDEPLPMQLGRYLWNIARGDFVLFVAVEVKGAQVTRAVKIVLLLAMTDGTPEVRTRRRERNDRFVLALLHLSNPRGPEGHVVRRRPDAAEPGA